MDRSKCFRPGERKAISKLPRQRNFSSTILAMMVVFVLLMPPVATAEESEGWTFRITPYLWMLGLDGTTAALGNDVPIDADFGDILDLLNMALAANMELSNGKWFFILDPMWASLEAPIETGGSIGGDVEIELLVVDALVGVNITEHFDIYGGARYYDQDITIVPDMMPKIDLGDDWTDYILGVRANSKISEKWSFTGRLDVTVGGDSDSAWLAQAMFLRHIGTNKHFDIGYRYYDVDYESGSGLTRFKWDVVQSGPVVGFSWEF